MPDQASGKQSEIAGPASKVQHFHPAGYSGVPKQAVGKGLDECRLGLYPFDFLGTSTENVIRLTSRFDIDGHPASPDKGRNEPADKPDTPCLIARRGGRRQHSR